MDEAWARALRDACREAGAPFFMKQMSGAMKPLPPIPADLLIREFPT
jgi:protein gp37